MTTGGQHQMLGDAAAGGSDVTGAECGSNPQICGFEQAERRPCGAVVVHTIDVP
eukprot:CAMPEP_0174363578 /NCGR_PEP_ID=MMETSP0811_2-20130205/69404_1 /TAXON_ID=73025 ORGANISM="Eutreptiella gymnastica-like, Strain CCMP1594" /NCGR_SAMPLE_ID=MMETSP0811_2 /ASSEMBLY_ACC=CAM_ASM_000667 /LENGTH=53 /DNA_ID=CAMNT_0015502403 /DNA_START=221 /DNA_END=382 /DNA_ORIENTATION=+